MSGEAHRGLRDERLRQRIGPAIKELREREGWSLRALGSRCEVSSAYLSRIERGASVPSFSILASIAAAFNVSPDYFIHFEKAAEELETSLAELLAALDIPRSMWHEFADLSMETQSALVESVSRLTSPQINGESRYSAAEVAVLNDGVEASIDLLATAMDEEGVSPVDFARHRTQIEEMNGDRYVILDRLCTLPASTIFDQHQVFQGTFGVKLEDPMLLKWWIRAQRSALRKTLEGSVSRAIYPQERMREYIRTGRWGTHLTFQPDLVRRHIESTIKLMRTHPNYQIGLSDVEPQLRMIGKNGAGVLLMNLDDYERPDGGTRMALRFSEPDVIDRFTEYFEDQWNAISIEQRDSAAVAEWLQQELSLVDAPGTPHGGAE